MLRGSAVARRVTGGGSTDGGFGGGSGGGGGGGGGGTGLLWSPPTLSSPTVWNVTSGDRSRSFGDSEDVQINLPATPITNMTGASIQIQGGRNIIMRGGELSKATADLGGSPNVLDHYGIYLVNIVGTVFIEGVWVHGNGMGQALISQNSRNDVHPTVIVQNCLFENLHPTTAGIHPDSIQIIAGPDVLRCYQNTFRSAGTCLQMQPYTGWTGHNQPVVGFDFRKMDFVAQLPHTDLSPGSYGLTKSASGNRTTPWPEYHEDIYYQENSHHGAAGAPNYSCEADTGGPWTNDWGAWNPGDDLWPNITGENIKHGFRPGGDLVVAGVNCGIGYVSPGYGGGGGGGGSQATFSITTNANDSTGEYQHSSWPPNAGTWVDDSGLDSIYAAKHFVSPTYYGVDGYLRFDTSSLPDAATITSASLKLYCIDKNDNNNYSLVGDYYDFGGSPTVAGDYVETASPSIFAAVDLGAIGIGLNTINLTDLTGISKTGITGIRLTLSSGTPTLLNHVRFAALEHTSLTEPQLVVNYT